MASTINASTSAGGGIIQTADASGDLALQAAGTTIASVSSTGVAVTGTLSASGAFTPTTMGGSVITSSTAQATTSGTFKDFTGIPSWVKRITVMFSGVSLSGTSNELIQIGTGSTPTTTGYVAAASYASIATSATAGLTSTAGFPMYSGFGAYTISGHMILTNISGNTWVESGVCCNIPTVSYTGQHAGTVTLSGTLGMVRITTVNGTDTFDAGSINIMYE